jgi:hypothetical protein
MPPNQFDRILTLSRGSDTFLIFLTEDGKVDSCVVQTPRSRFATRIDFSSLPYEIRQQVEDELDPHEL